MCQPKDDDDEDLAELEFLLKVWNMSIEVDRVLRRGAAVLSLVTSRQRLVAPVSKGARPPV
jgi:hypothetical protein